MNRAGMSTTFTILAATALLATTAASADTRIWQFDVLLDGKPIGYHTFDLALEGDNQVLESKASFDVKFLFINAFSYRHQSTEIWSDDGCLHSIDAMTDSNGKQLTVRGRSEENRFRLVRPTDSELTECVQTFAYWNPTVLKSTRLLNSQTGAYENVTVSFAGRGVIPVAGTPVEADRYRITTRKGDITLWYSVEDQTWLALEAPAKGGRTLSYRPTRIPLEKPDETVFAKNN
ncbi:MAG: hypothetical protein KJN77_02300 [Gammaproteobacteria bacterium]|nr:hypothetical protein [Gammaproteobacteria bacterium]